MRQSCVCQELTSKITILVTVVEASPRFETFKITRSLSSNCGPPPIIIPSGTTESLSLTPESQRSFEVEQQSARGHNGRLVESLSILQPSFTAPPTHGASYRHEPPRQKPRIAGTK